MSALFTFRRTKGGKTHYVATVIPKTTVIDKFTDDPAKALRFKEDDAKALLAALESDAKVYGRWAVIDAGGREVSVFTHATSEPAKPRDLGPAKIDLVGMVSKAPPTPVADRLLADEPDDSPFRELAALLTTNDDTVRQTLGDVATAAAREIQALTETVDELTTPPADDDTVLTDPVP